MEILIVDDHRALREEIVSLLVAELQPHAVTEAETGEDGLQQARALRPDLVLMDVMLPGMNGIETSRAIHRELPETPILVVSNHSGRSLVEAAVAAGASGYVLKDRAYEELIPAIRAVVGGGEYFGQDLTG